MTREGERGLCYGVEAPSKVGHESQIGLLSSLGMLANLRNKTGMSTRAEKEVLGELGMSRMEKGGKGYRDRSLGFQDRLTNSRKSCQVVKNQIRTKDMLRS